MKERNGIRHAAGLYCRISDDREGAGLGVQRQREDCEALARRLGWTVATVLTDNDLSAYSGKPRPDYRRLLDGLRSGAYDAVLCWHPDRLHRSPKELEEFITVVEETGAAVATVTAGEYDLTTPTGRMQARIVGAVARHESEHKAERIQRKHAQMALAGRAVHGSRRPFGYRKRGLKIIPDEAAEIRDAARRLLAGEPLIGVVRDWRRRVPTVDGGTWSMYGVKRLLTSGRVAGYRTHKGEVVARGEWEPILEEDTWTQLRTLLWDAARDNGGGHGPRRYVLRGLARCARCEAKLTTRARTNSRSAVYVCPPSTEGIGSCGGVGAVVPPFEAEVAAQVVATLTTGEGLAAALERASDDRPRVAALTGRLRADEERLSQLEVRYGLSEIGKPAYLKAREILAKRVETARRTLARQHRAGVLAEVPATVEGLTGWYDAATVERRRELLDAVVAEVRLHPARRGANRFDPARVEVVWRA